PWHLWAVGALGLAWNGFGLADYVQTKLGGAQYLRELGMTEEQIARELAMPQGTDISNDRIDPGASIPFMIVFVKEPPGVVKTLVYPIQAERLLN
ncbi:MAG: hypothetical protein N2Z74_04750, partial [Syntrophales bacterium]|nr:hypothetical protein [Syntrophales bacterium]